MAEKLQDRVSRGYMFALGRRNIFRRLLKLAVAPIYYMRMTGQARSMLGGWPVDRMGEPVPMFTYPAIDYLRSIESRLAECDVLEFGCGQSTKWWAPRVRSLLGVEKYAGFARKLMDELDEYPVSIITNREFDRIDGQYDIVVVDGEPRVAAGRFAASAVKPNGIIIVDNSDVRSIAEIPRLLHDQGFARIDYFGFSPTGVRPQCTSIFFRTPGWFSVDAEVMPISINSNSEELK